MNNQTLSTQWVARALMSALFLVAGIRKLLAWKATAVYFTAIGLPFGAFIVPIIIIVEVGSGLALIMGWRLREISAFLAVYSILTALIGHRFWSADPAQFSGQLNNFLKNMAMSGGFLLLFTEVVRKKSDHE